MDNDRNLLFGAMALQCGLINADEFAEAFDIYSATQASSLPAVCRQKGWLLPDDEAHIEYLIERRLAQGGGDVLATLLDECWLPAAPGMGQNQELGTGVPDPMKVGRRIARRDFSLLETCQCSVREP